MAQCPDPVDARDLSIVIPFRSDHRARLENLETVVRHLTATLRNAEIIVLEDGPRLVARALGQMPGVRYQGVPNSAGFHRTRLLNMGIEAISSRSFAASYDADAMIFPKAFARALALLRGGAPIVLPYNGRFLDVRGRARQRLVDTADLSDLPPETPRGWRFWRRGGLVCMNPASLGGVVMFARGAFSAAGGYHEGFRTWGFEDVEILERMGKFGHVWQRCDDWPLLHLSHPRRHGWGGWYGGARRNLALWRAMSALNRAELEAMIAQRALRSTPPPQL